MSQISKNALKVENNQSFPNNNTGYITPALLREFNVDMIDSTVNQSTFDTASAGWDNSISALNTFTASQQPSFDALNSFTASQIVTNSAFNSFTQSAGAELDSLSAWTGSWNAWTSSINEIRDNGILQGYSTRFFFNGLVSASIVQNVGGPIANVTIEQDGTKLDTASFNTFQTNVNAFTASTNIRLNNLETTTASINISVSNLNSFTASQNSFNASATASLVELLNLSSSLSGGYATQGELDQSASVLQANIDTKLNTSSFNAYTQSFSASVATSFSQSYATMYAISASTNVTISSSVASLSSSISITTGLQNGRLNSLESKTGSYATTGSNSFTGSQTITGSVYGNIVPLSISSNTASMDLAVSNFFTLQLVSESVTHITATNIRQGQTINLLVSQPANATGSVTYNSTFKFAAGSNYIPTGASGSKDIVTFITFDNASIYASAINNLI